MRDEPIRTVLWRGLFRPGREWCALARAEDGWRLAGTALMVVEDEPAIARYDITLGEDWATREVQVAVRIGATGERRLRIRADASRRWTIDRDPALGVDAPTADSEAFRGLVDIDLGFTSATNTLPIRRLASAIDDAVDVTAVWVSFPELTIEPLPQRYLRLGERRYRYESAGGAFVAEIEVDDLGLVVSYEGGWERIAESRES